MGIKPIDVVFDSGEVDTGRASGTSDNPRFAMLPAIERCVGISLIYANIPFTYYVIDETNNQFKVGSTTCSIAPGTYNSVNLIPQLQLATTGLNLAFFVDVTTSKLVSYLTVAGSFTLDFNVANSCAEVLGFAQTSYASIDPATVPLYDNADTLLTKQYIQGPRVVNLSGPSQMFVSSDLGSIIYGNVRNQTGNKSLIGFFPVNNNYQGTIDMVRENPPVIKTSPVNVSTVELKLTIGNRTSYGASGLSYLSLNGEYFQVAIRFWVESDVNEYTTDTIGNAEMTSVNTHRSSIFRDPMSAVSKRKVFRKK